MTKDGRFTITFEYVGSAKPRFVLRFCGEMIGHYLNASIAKQARELAIIIQAGKIAQIEFDLLKGL